MRLYSKVIKEVEQSDEGPHIGAYFDFDGTVIYGYSAITYLREQVRRGDISPRQLVEIFKTMASFSLGNVGFSAMISDTSKFLKGVEEQKYIEFGENLYKSHIAQLIYPESRALIEAHLKRRHTVVLVSAATPYQITAAAAELGIEHVRCTRLETSKGKFTGEVIKPTCYGMGKVAAAQEFERSHGVDPSHSFFYSDSDEDIQLLEYVGKPRPLNPNAKLRRIANGRGWPVQDFNSRGGVGVKDYVRTIATQSSMVFSAFAGLPIYALTGSMRKSRNFSISMFGDLATAIAGIELDVTGEQNVWTNRPCVFIFNHQSQADTIIIPALLRRDLAGIGKKEIGEMPIIGKLMQYGGTVLIDRDNTASALEAMRPLVEVMQKEGRSVCMAPEGTRSTSTNLGRFKKGAFHLAMQAGVPIVPIVIHNAIDVAHRGDFIIRPATVKVTVLPPVDTSEWSAENMDQQVDMVRDMFLLELDQMPIAGAQQVEVNSPKPLELGRRKTKAPKPEIAKRSTARKSSKANKVVATAARRKRSAAKPNSNSYAPKTSSSAASNSVKIVKPSSTVSRLSKRRSNKTSALKLSARAIKAASDNLNSSAGRADAKDPKPSAAPKRSSIKRTN